jgi:hypothetical protein
MGAASSVPSLKSEIESSLTQGEQCIGGIEILTILEKEGFPTIYLFGESHERVSKPGCKLIADLIREFTECEHAKYYLEYDILPHSMLDKDGNRVMKSPGVHDVGYYEASIFKERKACPNVYFADVLLSTRRVLRGQNQNDYNMFISPEMYRHLYYKLSRVLCFFSVEEELTMAKMQLSAYKTREDFARIWKDPDCGFFALGSTNASEENSDVSPRDARDIEVLFNKLCDLMIERGYIQKSHVPPVPDYTNKLQLFQVITWLGDALVVNDILRMCKPDDVVISYWGIGHIHAQTHLLVKEGYLPSVHLEGHSGDDEIFVDLSKFVFPETLLH